MRTDANEVEVTAETGAIATNNETEAEAETETEPEAGIETHVQRPALHEETLSSSTADDVLREIRKRHLAFKQVGRGDGLEPRPPAGLVPLPLYPYLDMDRLRGDYPLCLFGQGTARIARLTQTMDDAIASARLEGDELEQCKRWAIRLETVIRQQVVNGPRQSLYKLWNVASEQLSNLYQDEPAKQERLHEALASVRNGIAQDARLLGCNKATAPTILETLWQEIDASGEDTSYQTIAEVVERLNNLLSLEFEESESGLAPSHLKESVGDAFESDLDFEALSDLLHDAPHGESLSSVRQGRIREIVAVLQDHLEHRRKSGRSIEHLSGSDQLADHIEGRLQKEASVTSAWTAARLEIANRFDETRHAALLTDDQGYRWGQPFVTPSPLAPVHIQVEGVFDGHDVSRLCELFDRQIPVRVLVTVEDCVAGGGISDSEPYLSASLGERLLSAAQPNGFLCQRSLADADGLLDATRAFLRCETTAVLIVYGGSAFGETAIPTYLKSAAGTTSRAIPVFLCDSGQGLGWAQRFSVDGNEQPERVWTETQVEVTAGDGTVVGQRSSFSAAQLMACDSRFADHFGVIDRADWHDDLVPIEDYSGEQQRVPFIEMASQEGAVHRVITTDYLWSQTSRVAARWRGLRELGGIENSFAVKAIADESSRLETDYRNRMQELEAEHRATLEATTSKLAEEIVANIASGLLGEASAGPVTPRAPKAVETPPPAGDTEQAILEPEPELESAPDVEEDDLELFDEAYIETPRCTACDECTTINPRLFSYNDDKQAFIADVTAGTFREMVLAAEKCPVRIIHPGKPLNPDEPHLDELVKRAEPFQ